MGTIETGVAEGVTYKQVWFPFLAFKEMVLVIAQFARIDTVQVSFKVGVEPRIAHHLDGPGHSLGIWEHIFSKGVCADVGIMMGVFELIVSGEKCYIVPAVC
jgi:hypothetical protein